MAYADKGAGSNKLVSVLLVVLLHVALGFGLIIGLNYEAITKELKKTQVIDIKPEEDKEEPPPPPPEPDTPPPAPEVFAKQSPIPQGPQMKTTPEKKEAPVNPCTAGQSFANGVCVDADPNAGKEFCGETNTYVAKGTCEVSVKCKNGSKAPGNSKANCRISCEDGTSVQEDDKCVPPKKKAPPTKPKAKGSPGNWVPESQYPRGALRDKREGRVGFTLSVGANGRPTGCTVTSSSGHADLDQAACDNLMKRAKFDPATEDGQPVASSYSNAVTWQIRDK
jgi:periplasmic protein TonB